MDEKGGLVRSLKHHNFKGAVNESIQIVGEDAGVRLIPVGDWILGYSDLILTMCEWRQQSSRNFFARFPSSIGSMREYLLSHSIRQNETILFVIHSESDGFQGHLGLSSITKTSAEIDAVMLSPRLRGQGLFLRALFTLVNWARRHLNTTEFVLDVLSSNEAAIGLYSRLGFKIESLTPLKEVTEGSNIQLTDCSFSERDTDLWRISMVMRTP